MQKIPSKQLSGVVDSHSEQSVTGFKTFEAGMAVGRGNGSRTTLMQDGFLYFVQDPRDVSQGDVRLGMSPLTGQMSLQKLIDGLWVNIVWEGCNSGTGGGDTGGCLVYGTLITMADGSLRAIESLEIGDQVQTLAIDGLDSEVEDAWKTFSTQQFQSTPGVSTVTALQKAQFGYYFDVNDRLKITFEHPVLVRRNDTYQFLRAVDLVVGDHMLQADGSWVEIHSIVRHNTTVPVVNINVESQDTYFAQGLLVHNLNDPYQEKQNG